MTLLRLRKHMLVAIAAALVAAACQANSPAGLRHGSSQPEPVATEANPAADNAVFVYGGKWSDNRFLDILQFETDMRDSYLAAVGVSRIFHRFNEHLHLEGETNLARHWGQQDHLEINAAANLRWNTFPWDRFVNTSFAYGLGPSYAFGRPVIEERRDRPLSRGLVFMVAELTLAPPKRSASPWEGFVRIHHRSGAFGVVSDAGGSNFITSGVRYRF